MERKVLITLFSTRFDASLAPHTGVLPRAAGDGLDGLRTQNRSRRPIRSFPFSS
jgi:hypothetical protein